MYCDQVRLYLSSHSDVASLNLIELDLKYLHSHLVAANHMVTATMDLIESLDLYSNLDSWLAVMPQVTTNAGSLPDLDTQLQPRAHLQRVVLALAV